MNAEIQTHMETLQQPEKIDWNNHHAGSSYQRPPEAQENGQDIVYKAVLPKDLASPARLKVTNEGLRAFEFGPVQLQLGAGRVAEIKYFTQSVKKFTNRTTGKVLEVNGVSKLLRAAGFAGKPNTNAEYEAAVKAIAGRPISLIIDWRAYNKDTSEEVRGYANFPDDPERPGKKMAVLKQGTLLPNGDTVKSEILFANAQVRYVQDRQRA